MGELFDHGLDTLKCACQLVALQSHGADPASHSCPLGALIQASAMALGPSPLAMLCVLVPCWSMYVVRCPSYPANTCPQCSLGSVYAQSTWEEYHTGTLYLGFVNGSVRSCSTTWKTR